MDEENKAKEEIPETEGSGEGDQSEKTDPLDRADAIAERLEKANKETERLLNENKEFEARKRFSGNSEAGKSEEKPKEETAKEYMDKVMSGKV